MSIVLGHLRKSLVFGRSARSSTVECLQSVTIGVLREFSKSFLLLAVGSLGSILLLLLSSKTTFALDQKKMPTVCIDYVEPSRTIEGKQIVNLAWMRMDWQRSDGSWYTLKHLRSTADTGGASVSTRVLIPMEYVYDMSVTVRVVAISESFKVFESEPQLFTKLLKRKVCPA